MAQNLDKTAAAHFERGCALQAEQRFQAAIAAYDAALALEPLLVAAHSNRGAAFASLNRGAAALQCLDRAIELAPDHAEAHFCRAIVLLSQGHLPAGWRDFEQRWNTAAGRALRLAKNFPQPLWSGSEVIAGKVLLVYCERGLGDTLQFCRYVLQLLQLQARVILQVQAPLVGLLRSLSAEVCVLSETQAPPHVDLQCPLLSLPLAFDTTLQSIPAPRSYLKADADRVAQFRSLTDALPAPRIGLAWRGDASNPDDRHRSLPLRELLSFLPPDLHYFSLQQNVTAEEQRLLDAHARAWVQRGDLDFEQAAALCECLDLVLAIDTSLAHLAAALGVASWILLPFNADCRWLLDREDSPWYPTARLFRQARAGDWAQVLGRVREALEQLPRTLGC